MFPTIKNCSQDLETYLTTRFELGTDLFEFRDLFARSATNIISSITFGIDSDCINDPNDIFRRMGSKIFDPNPRNGFRFMMQILFPKMYHKFGQKVVDKEVEEFMFSIVKQTVEHREQQNVSRNDFMQLLIQLKNQGYLLTSFKDEKPKEECVSKKLTMNELTAQCFVFYIAGIMIS